MDYLAQCGMLTWSVQQYVLSRNIYGKDLGTILVNNSLAVDGYHGGKKTHDWCAGIK